MLPDPCDAEVWNGHAGLALGTGEYYDFGPDDPNNRPQGLYQSCEGGPWWDKPDANRYPGKGTPEDVGINDVIDWLKKNNKYDVVQFTVCVPCTEAQRIRDWWSAVYTNFPDYQIPGPQCTALVCDSIKGTTPGTNWQWAPAAYANDLANNFRNPCGGNTKLAGFELIVEARY